MAGHSQSCYCCGKVLTTDSDKKYRCRLDNRIFQDVLDVLVSLVSELSGEVDVDKLKDGFGCRACIQKLKKFVTAQKELRSRISRAMSILPKARPESGMSTLSTSHHRPRASAVQQSPVMLSHDVSPPVSVSIRECIVNHMYYIYPVTRATGLVANNYKCDTVPKLVTKAVTLYNLCADPV